MASKIVQAVLGLGAIASVFLLIRKASAAPVVPVLPPGASKPLDTSGGHVTAPNVDAFGYDEVTDAERQTAWKSLYSVSLLSAPTTAGKPSVFAVAPLLPGMQNGAAILAKFNMKTDTPTAVLSQASAAGIFFMPATAEVAQVQAKPGGGWKLFLRPLEAANLALGLGDGFELPSP